MANLVDTVHWHSVHCIFKVKGNGHYWLFYKAILSITIYFVTSIKHCEKRPSLKLRSFWERGNFSHKYSKTSGLKTFMHLNLCNKNVYFVHYSLATLMTNWVQIFTGLVFTYISLLQKCWDTPSENTGLWQLPKVVSAFKPVIMFTQLICTKNKINKDMNCHCAPIVMKYVSFSFDGEVKCTHFKRAFFYLYKMRWQRIMCVNCWRCQWDEPRTPTTHAYIDESLNY